MLVTRGQYFEVIVSNRYEIRDTLGQGGMGIVYRAYDSATKRNVALKTLRQTDAVAVEMFSKEWSVLAGISHPNIVDILDCGEYTENGQRKPFFVMPLLPGKTLDQLIRDASQRLTVERTVEILVQTCRGLQAAHEHGLVHRDLKPSNIFVMEDDTAKIIDFGVVHLAGAQSVTGIKGTLQYMAPEQFAMKAATPLSDIFSLGVVGYEALTGRKPFARKTDGETAEAISKHLPPPASEVNPGVNDLISRVIHKAMAKEPRHRFANARELAETLLLAVRNQPIEKFDRSKIRPRVERAKKAFNEGDAQFAQDILNELEAEGNIDSEMAVLRLQIDQASRKRTIRQLLESAQIRLEQEEHPLALQRVQEVLQIDPDNPEALRIRGEIESQRSDRQVNNWLRLAREHLERGAFAEARHGLEEARKLGPGNTKVKQLLAELERQEHEISEVRLQKEKLYNAAKEAFQNGEISTALTKLERILELNRKMPDRTSPERDALYQTIYNQVRSEHDASQMAYQDARRHLAEKDFAKALAICEDNLKKHSGQALFQALKLEVGEQERQELSSYTAEVGRRLDAEPDLDRKLSILKEAAGRYPNEPQFQQSLKLIRERRDLMLSIVAKARQYEERGQFAEAIGQWEILRSINPQYPALAFEVEQLQRRREQQSQEEAKIRWVEQIDRMLETGDFERARGLALQSLAEYPGDAELAGLERLTRQGIERNQESQRLLEEGRQLCGAGNFDDGIEKLRHAAELDERNPLVRSAVVAALVDRAQVLLADDWRAAEALIQKALELDPNYAFAKSLRSSVQDYRRKETVNGCLAECRELQAKGEMPAALAVLQQCLETYPNEGRLIQLRTTLQHSVAEADRRKQRTEDLGELRKLSEDAQRTYATAAWDPVVERARFLSARSGDDPEIHTLAEGIVQRASLDKTSLFGPSPTGMLVGNGQEAAGEALPAVGARPDAKKPPATPGNSPASPWKNGLQWLSPLQMAALAGILLLILGGWMAIHLLPKTNGQKARATTQNPLLHTYAFEVHATPPGALVRIDEKSASGFPVQLTEGRHKIDVSKPGYIGTSRQITVGLKSAPFVVTLSPEPQRLRLITGLTSGKVLLDGEPAGELQEGSFSKDDLSLAEHTVRVMAGRNELLAVHFKSAPAAAAQVVPPLTTQDLLVISSFGDRARVYSGPTALRVGWKDQPPQPVPAEGLELSAVGTANEIVASDGKNQRALPLESGNAPVLSIHLNDAADTRAILRVTSNVEGAQLIVNGKQQKWRLYKGAYVERVEPGKYTVKLFKPGYEDISEQSVTLAKGEMKKLQFVLNALPVTASLAIDGGTPGTEVWIDQALKGHLDAAGRFNFDLTSGPHDIRLNNDLFEPKELEKRIFTAGQQVRISGAEARLKPLGSINFQISTQGADIKYMSEGETSWHSARNEGVPLKAGRYQVLISADNYETRDETVTVESGRVTNVSGYLKAKVAKRIEALPPPEQNLLPPDAWEQDDSGFSVNRKGIGWIAGKNGNFKIELLRKSRKLAVFGGTVEWMIGVRNKGKDKVVYKLSSDGSLTRSVTTNGKLALDQKVERVSAVGDSFQLQILIEPTRIVIRDAGKGTVDDYSDPGANFTAGSFGFSKGTHLKITR